MRWISSGLVDLLLGRNTEVYPTQSKWAECTVCKHGFSRYYHDYTAYFISNMLEQVIVLNVLFVCD